MFKGLKKCMLQVNQSNVVATNRMHIFFILNIYLLLFQLFRITNFVERVNGLKYKYIYIDNYLFTLI